MQRDVNAVKNDIMTGKTALGIEFGSTRIKAVLVGADNMPIATGSHDWENSYEDNIWTYSLEAVSYTHLSSDQQSCQRNK